MTVLTTAVRDIAGADDRTIFTFEIPIVRGSTDGGVVTVRQCRYVASGGVLTTDDLEPGPAVLRMSSGLSTEYRITIPDSAEPVQLWPLIDAATPPGESVQWGTGYVRDAGGVARVRAVPAADYPGLVKDPATYYILFE